MSCFHHLDTKAGHESVFSVDQTAIAWGPGVLSELGAHLSERGARRVALLTDAWVRRTPTFAAAEAALRKFSVAVYDEVQIEPTDESFIKAAAFAREGNFDAYVSVGGGSVIDTCKAAMLYATYPASFETYVNAPLGDGKAVPGPLPLHIACPTTCGTGAECTGIAVFDWVALKKKTGIVSRTLRPTLALIDPDATLTLPSTVVMASGFDVLCHAVESFTARPYTERTRPASPFARPMSQGKNPFSDVGSLEALRLGGKYLVRAVRDASDREARHALSWAATLAGIAFGNAGVHLPHAMSYAVAGLVESYHCDGYPEGPLVPHGISVVENAPAVFRWTAEACPKAHLDAAEALGADVRGASLGDAGQLLFGRIVELMRACGAPLGLADLGYTSAHLDDLASGAFAQKRLVDNAPRPTSKDDLRNLFEASLYVR